MHEELSILSTYYFHTKKVLQTILHYYLPPLLKFLVNGLYMKNANIEVSAQYFCCDKRSIN
jgi:hypothetical protein